MHAALTFSALPLFLGALLSDWAYAQTYEVQWLHFASWLVAGGLLMTGLALLAALVAVLASASMRRRAGWIYLLVLVLAFALGFVNALVHAKDGWAAMPDGLILSAVVVLLVAVASVLALFTLRRGAGHRGHADPPARRPAADPPVHAGPGAPRGSAA